MVFFFFVYQSQNYQPITIKYLVNFRFIFLGALLLISNLASSQNERTDLGPDHPSNNFVPQSGKANIFMATTVFTGTLDGSESTQVGRLNRNGVASMCGAPKACDIFDGNLGRFFDLHTIVNPDPNNATCFDIILNTYCTEGNMQVNAYLNSFDPNNICTNYLGDPGLSSGIPADPVAMSVEVPAGQTLVLHVFNTNVGDLCQEDGGYEIILNYLSPGNAVPTMSQWGFLILAFCALSIGVVYYRSNILRERRV